ncbi:MAG: hypothetical protein ACYCT0_11870, partial [Sulfobacillus sp.]
VVRMELINHYQEHRQEREGAGWPPSEAHRAAMDQLGSSIEAQSTWACYVGMPEALPWTLGFLTVALQAIGVFGWHWGIYLSWITAGFAIVSGGRHLKETVVTTSRYWLMQWRKFPATMKLVGGLVGFIVGFEPVWAGEPIWNGHTLDVLVISWPIPVGLVILSTLTWTTWHTVNHMKTSPMAASSQVGGGAALGLVMGGSLGFGTTWTWLLLNIIPPNPAPWATCRIGRGRQYPTPSARIWLQALLSWLLGSCWLALSQEELGHIRMVNRLLRTECARR